MNETTDKKPTIAVDKKASLTIPRPLLAIPRNPARPRQRKERRR